MRQLLRITATFALGFLLTAGMAFGQNSVDIDQTSSTADIDQRLPGSGSNTVEGLKGGSMSGGNAWTQTSGSVLDVLQNARDNANHVVKGEQTGGGGNHVARVQQLAKGSATAIISQTGGVNGRENVARLRQRSTGSASDGSNARVNQNGSFNLFAGPGYPGYTETVTFSNAGIPHVNQSGNNDNIRLNQFFNNNTFIGQQLGDGDVIRMTQKRGATAEILQDGSGHSVAANQDGSGQFVSNKSELFVSQTGSGHSVYGEQTAQGSTAYVSQSGSSSQARLIQQ